MKEPVLVDSLLLTDEELAETDFRNNQNIWICITKVSDGNIVNVYAVIDLED